MNAEAILKKIEQDARDTAARLLREAQAKAEAAREASEQKIAAERTAALEAARRDGLDLDDRMRRMAKLDARKAMLAAKRGVLGEAFDKALSLMRAMPDRQARAFGLSMLLASARGDELLVPDPEAAWCDAAFVREANEALQKAGKPGEIKLAAKAEAAGGGFSMVSGGVTVDCSCAAALSMQRAALEAEVAAVLFD